VAIGRPAIRPYLRRNGELCHVFEPMLPQQFTAAGFKLTQFNLAQTDTKLNAPARAAAQSVALQNDRRLRRHATPLSLDLR
jgi:hypothetical protein